MVYFNINYYSFGTSSSVLFWSSHIYYHWLLTLIIMQLLSVCCYIPPGIGPSRACLTTMFIKIWSESLSAHYRYKWSLTLTLIERFTWDLNVCNDLSACTVHAKTIQVLICLHKCWLRRTEKVPHLPWQATWGLNSCHLLSLDHTHRHSACAPEPWGYDPCCNLCYCHSIPRVKITSQQSFIQIPTLENV